MTGDYKIDPHTGVRVLTHIGFLKREAERKGRTLDEELQAEASELAEIEREEIARLTTDAFSIILAAVRWDNEQTRGSGVTIHYGWGSARSGVDYNDDRPLPMIDEPVAIIEVLEVQPAHFGPHYKERIRARMKRPDGTEGIIVWTHEHWAGSYVDPPEDEVEVSWETVATES